MRLFEFLGMGAVNADEVDARAPKLAAANRFFEPEAVALLNAALAGDETEVRRLAAAGVNANSQGPKSNSKNTPQITLLNYATFAQNERALALLIAAGADPLFEPRDSDGNAFLFAVVRHDAKVPTHTQLLRMKQFMETQGISFPVETSAEIRTHKGIK